MEHLAFPNVHLNRDLEQEVEVFIFDGTEASAPGRVSRVQDCV